MAEPTKQELEAFHLLAIAVHEAGHAVACRRARIKVRSARANANGGVVHFADTTDEQAAGELVVYFAGLEAQARFLCKHGGYSLGAGRRMAKPGARHDLARARQLARQAGLSEAAARREAQRLVARNWGEIYRLGKRLARRGRL